MYGLAALNQEDRGHDEDVEFFGEVGALLRVDLAKLPQVVAAKIRPGGGGGAGGASQQGVFSA